MPAVLFKPAATADISDIWKYTFTEWGLNQAELYILELETVCARLSDGLNPEIAVDYISPGYRKVFSGKHAIYFTRQEKVVTVIRILHHRMDITEAL